MLIESFRKFISNNKNKKTINKSVIAKNTYYYANVVTVPSSPDAGAPDAGGM